MSPRQPPEAAAVICHAHPLYGGTMNMKVVFRAARTLQRHGIAALRFNFRSVGLSQGVHDEGRGEQDDVRAAIDELQTRFPSLPLIIGGFSFGAAMALRVGGRDPRVGAIIALGFPATLISDTSFLWEGHKARLFIQCESDEFGSGDAIQGLVQELPEPRSVVILPGGNHLFEGRLDELEQALGSWVGHSPWMPG